MPLPDTPSLMYHEVTDHPETTGFQRPGARPFTLTRQAFAEHLEAIAQSAFVPALVTDACLDQPGQHLFLTFDDGGRSALDVVELLDQMGWKAHFFITTNRTGQRTFLDGSGIREIRAAGHIVGSHSHTHPDIFRDLPTERMIEEWRTSCDVLSSLLGEPCVTASVPGGDISPTVLRIAGDEGIRYLFTSEPWLHPLRVGECWVLGRISVKSSLRITTLRELLALRGWGRAQLERHAKEVARRSLATLYGMYVRRATRGAEMRPKN